MRTAVDGVQTVGQRRTWVGTEEGRSLPATIVVSASSNKTGGGGAVLWGACWPPMRSFAYLWNIKLKLRKFAFKFSNVVIGFVTRDPHLTCRSGTTKGVQVEWAGRRGCTWRRSGESGDVALSVERYIWKCGCGAFKVDVGIVEEVTHHVE